MQTVKEWSDGESYFEIVVSPAGNYVLTQLVRRSEGSLPQRITYHLAPDELKEFGIVDQTGIREATAEDVGFACPVPVPNYNPGMCKAGYCGCHVTQGVRSKVKTVSAREGQDV